MSAIVLFDGVCNFCNSSVQFIIKKDTNAYFSFAPLQSEYAQKILTTQGLNSMHFDSIVLIENGMCYTKTNAALRIARRLNGIYPLAFYLFYPIPPFLRDWTYNIIAKYRYKIWGKKDACMIPTPEIKQRFLA